MNLSPRLQHRNQLSLAIAVAMTAAAAVPTIVFAQQASAPADDPATSAQVAQKKAGDLDKVTVTGYRYSIQKSLDQKRDANAIVEVITAEDVSKFPDKNVADALQRVPGVIISRDGGEGKYVSVRGLASDLTLTELNGNFIASSESNSDPTRSFNYALMPSHMLSSAELFKTPEARIDEGGIGGTVILHTRRPLDLPSNSGFISAEGTMADTRAHEKIDPQVSAQYSWHSKDNRFGVLVGLTKQTRSVRSMSASTEDWHWYTDTDANGNRVNSPVDVNGHALDPDSGNWWGQGSGFNAQTADYSPGQHYSGFFMPTSVDFGIHNEKRERKGGQLTFQYRPTDNLTLTANYFRFDMKGDYTDNTLKIPEWNLSRFSWDSPGSYDYGRHLNGLAFDGSHSITTGAQYQMLPGKVYPCSGAQATAMGLGPNGWGSDDCAMPTPQLTGSYHKESNRSQSFDLGAEWKISTLFSASFKGGRTWSSGGPTMAFRMSAKPRVQTSGAPTYANGNTYSAWDISGTPSMTFSPNLQQNLMNGIAEIDIGSTDSSWTHDTVSQNYYQADFTKLFENSSWLDSINFGVKYRDGQVHRNTGNNYWVCQGSADSYDNRFQTGCDPNAGVAQPWFFMSNSLPNTGGAFNASAFPAINYPAYIAYLNNTYGGMKTRTEPNFVFDVNEKIRSGYFQLNFKTERLRGNIGLRYARTTQNADSTDQINTYDHYFIVDGAGNPVACPNPPPQGIACQGGYELSPTNGGIQTFALTKVSKTYNDVLPSFNIAYDIARNLVLRGAASKVIARQGYSDIAFPGQLNYVSPAYAREHALIGGGGTPGWSGSGSNKELQPYQANQYDLGLEWYFHPGSVVGMGLFRKDVKNFIVPVVLDQQQTVNGQSVLVQGFSTSANGRNGKSTGIELYAQHTFDFGLGVQVNATRNNTNLAAIVLDGQEIGKSPLVGSAKEQANVSVFYETQRYLLRASYNWRGSVVGAYDGGLKMNQYAEPYKQLDLNASFNITNNFTVSGSILNVTKEVQRTHWGTDTTLRLVSNNYSGRQMYLGATYKF